MTDTPATRRPEALPPPEEPIDTAEPGGSVGAAWILRGLLRRWKLVLALWLVLAVPAVPLILKFVKPKYTATAQVEVLPSVPAILYTDEEKPIPFFDQYLNTQARIAQSQSVLLEALASPTLDRPDVRERLPWLGGNEAVAVLRESATALTLPRTQIVEIQVKNHDRQMAILLAQAVLDAYMKRALQLEAAEQQQQREILQKEQIRLRDSLKAWDDEIRRLAASFNTASDRMFEAMRELKEGATVQLEQERDRAAAQIADLEYRLQQMKDPDTVSIPEDLSAVREQAVEQDAGVRLVRNDLEKAVATAARLRGALPSDHPSIGEAEKAVETARTKLAQARETAREAAESDIRQRLTERLADQRERLSAELERARRHLASLEDKVKANQKRSMDIGENDLAIRRAREEKESTKGEYDRVVDKIRQMEFENTENRKLQGRIRVVSAAEVRPDGIDDKRTKAVPAAVLGALALACGVALLRDRLDTQLHDTRQVEMSMGLRLLGAVPSIAEVQSGRITRDDLLESYRLIRATLSGMTTDGRPPRALLVTSAQAGEGKTSLAVSLALSLAETGSRVLLVDGDIQAPQIGRLLKINPPYSLKDVLLGRRALADCVGRSPSAGVDVLIARLNGDSARGALSTQSALQLVRSAAPAYDHVVIDSPPALGAADTLVWAQAADGVIVSSLVGSSNTQAMRTACQRLAAVGARVLGSVIANVSVTESYYSYSSASSSVSGRPGKRKPPLVLLPEDDKPAKPG